LLVGDTAARYSWRCAASAASATATALGQPVDQGPLPEAAAALDAVPESISSNTTPSTALGRHQSIGKQQQQQQLVCPASPPSSSSTSANSSMSCSTLSCKAQRKAVQQPPGGNLEEWLGEAEMQLQVRLDVSVSFNT
jgi:hypothetical protein